jgi:hypothetical protein
MAERDHQRAQHDDHRRQRVGQDLAEDDARRPTGRSPAPACTNSRVRSERNSPRTSRATGGQETMPMAEPRSSQARLKIATSTIGQAKSGWSGRIRSSASARRRRSRRSSPRSRRATPISHRQPGRRPRRSAARRGRRGPMPAAMSRPSDVGAQPEPGSANGSTSGPPDHVPGARRKSTQPATARPSRRPAAAITLPIERALVAAKMRLNIPCFSPRSMRGSSEA